jgi:hypothetical protein
LRHEETATFFLSVDERGACRGFATTEGLSRLRERADEIRDEAGIALGIVAIDMPLPPGTAAATAVAVEPLSVAGAATEATAWFALLREDGSCVAAAFGEEHLPDVRLAAERYESDTSLSVCVIRVDVPLPPGSHPARVAAS